MVVSPFFRNLSYSPLGVVVVVGLGVLLWPIARVEELYYPVVHPETGVLSLPPSLSSRVVSVEGTWAMYPGVLADPVSLVADPGLLPAPEAAAVPWPVKRDQGGYRPDKTSGTYHLRIAGLTPGVSYGLFIKEIANAYRVFVDGELVAFRGEAETDSRYRTAVGPKTALFTARGTTADFVVQWVDKTTSLGGIWQKVYFGPAQQVLMLHSLAAQRDVFFLASLAMMALFQWILAFVIRRDRAPLFLAIFCTAILVKSAFSEMMFGFTWFPWLGYETGMVLTYFALIVMIPIFLSYARACFPQEAWSRVAPWFWLPAGVEACFVVFTPFEWYQNNFVWFQLVLVVGCVVALATGIRAALARREGAFLFVLGFLAVFVAGLNDILFSNQLVQTGYLLNMGLYYFLLAQSVIIALRYRAALAGVEEASRNLEVKVADRTRELAQERNTFEQWAKEDSLTGLYNKRYLNEVLDTEFEAFQRYGQVFSVLMIDLDWFKRVNDTHGHLCGDRMLADLAAVLKANLRKTDLCARFGGEEFVVVMRHTRLEEARQAAEHLRSVVETTPFEADGATLGMTISVGAAEVSVDTPNEGALIKRADEALYLAKATGRNRVVCL